MTSFIEISSFFEILDLIDKDTLVVLDIDETVMEYTGISDDYWWNLFYTHYEKLKDYDLAEKAAGKEWQELLVKSKPTHTDKEGINALFAKIEKEQALLVFETARSGEMSFETEKHFEYLGFPKKSRVFYDSKEKGPRLKAILGIFPELVRSKIIFVDDLEHNLISMDQMFGPLAKCFKFVTK